MDSVRKLTTTVDNTQDYKFEVNATSTAAYTFVGWYRLIDGDYKAINPSNMSSLTGAVTQNSDVTLVARYIKTSGGSIMRCDSDSGKKLIKSMVLRTADRQGMC